MTHVRGLDSRDARAVDLRALENALKPQIIHAHNVMNPTAIKLANVITIQDHRVFCPGRGKWTLGGEVCRDPMSERVCRGCFEDDAYAERILALTQARLDALRPLWITVLSRYMAAELEAVGVPPERITVIPPFVPNPVAGVGPERPTAPVGPPCVLFVGRLVAAKGLDDAIEAWRRSGTDLPLVFAGTGRERGRLEAEGCTVLGWLDRPALIAATRGAAAVLLPSRWQEPFGIVGLEALALGVPVVAWDSGGVFEWLPEDTPRVAWGDVEGLAAALTAAIGRPASTPRGSYDRAALMDRLEAVYAAVLEAER